MAVNPQTTQSLAIAAHLAAHEKKMRDRNLARESRAMRNKKRGLTAAIENLILTEKNHEI